MLCTVVQLSPLEIEDYDEQLQKALDLSRMEYEANSMYWEHSYVAKSDGHGGQNNNTQGMPDTSHLETVLGN